MGLVEIRFKPDGLELGVQFLLGFNGLGIIVSNSTHSPPQKLIGALLVALCGIRPKATWDVNSRIVGSHRRCSAM